VTDYYPPVVGGISTQTESLVNGLLRRGHQVFVHAVSGPQGSAQNHDLTVARGTHTSSFLPFLFKNKDERNLPPFPDPLFLHRLGKVVRGFQPDVIHAHGWVMFPVSFMAKKSLGVITGGTLHDYGFICPKRDLVYESAAGGDAICERIWVGRECIRCSGHAYGPLKSLGIVACLRLCETSPERLDFLTAVSNYVAEKARVKFGIPVETVPNFIDPNSALASHADGNASEIPETHILFVGRLTPTKGVLLLMEAHSLLRKRFPHVKLTIIGKPDPRWGFNIPDSTISCRRSVSRDQLYAFYQRSKIVVIPSVWAEPRSMVALEAMAFSKPLVVTKVGGLKETVVDHKTGLVTKPNPGSLAEALEYLLSNPSTMEEMGAKGRQHLLRNYTPEVVLPRIETLYRR